MEPITLFVHRQGAHDLAEIAIHTDATWADLLDHPGVAAIIEAMGVDADAVTIFIDEHETPVTPHLPLNYSGARHSSRVHLTHCHKIEVEVFFQHRSACRLFAPGAKVRRVKDWTAQEFGLAKNDAIEHVLETHDSTDRPNPATPLSALAHDHHCKAAFDLVPDKRVEG
jgi:hypothetical protein